MGMKDLSALKVGSLRFCCMCVALCNDKQNAPSRLMPSVFA